MNSTPPIPADDSIDFAELFARIKRGLPLSLGLACLGLGLGIVLSLILAYKQPAVSTLRVTFSFPGFERGIYPNGTKFQPDDVRAPDVINEAINRLGLKNNPELASRIRGAIIINGFVSPALVKERDRLRALGQTVPPLIPDEYEISLSLPRDSEPGVRQRELLLTEVINSYRDKFVRSYVELPLEFGNAFGSLNKADFVDYELILTKEVQALASFLHQQVVVAGQFRSPSNNLSFQDVLKQAELFSQISMTEVLGLIYMNGLSRDRNNALLKMDYYLRILDDQERHLMEEESVVLNLLKQTQERTQNYVVASATQARPSSQPLLEQSFIDSLLSNDAYNFLVRKALEAGLAVKRAQAEKSQLTERRQRMESFTKAVARDQAALSTEVRAALQSLESQYKELLTNVRTCLTDYSRQEFGNAVRISLQAGTKSVYRDAVIGGVLGGVAAAGIGLGLSLIFMATAPMVRREG